MQVNNSIRIKNNNGSNKIRLWAGSAVVQTNLKQIQK